MLPAVRGRVGLVQPLAMTRRSAKASNGPGPIRAVIESSEANGANVDSLEQSDDSECLRSSVHPRSSLELFH